MPPASKAASAASKIKATPNYLSTSPDTDNPVVEQEPQPRSSKKKKNRNAAQQQTQTPSQPDQKQNGEIAQEASPPAHPEPIRSIPRTFPAPRSRSPTPTSDDQDELPITEKVSDDYTPPHEDDTWLQDAIYGKGRPAESSPRHDLATSPPMQPGFSTRGGFDAKSPPISPPQRHARPVSYGGSIPPLPMHTRMSTSPYSRAPSAYGSPPAPHLPQQHFYRAQDIDLGLPRVAAAQYAEEPTLIRYTKLPSTQGQLRQGVILGFEGRVSILTVDHGRFEEIGAITGFSGIVIDAVLMNPDIKRETRNSEELAGLIAITIHGLRTPEYTTADAHSSYENNPASRPANPVTTEYATRIEVYALCNQRKLGLLLQTPGVTIQPSFRGSTPTPPNQIGSLKLYASGSFLLVASGTSGEVYVFAISDTGGVGFECMGKLWTSIQPQIQRRDSSHGRAPDTDASPADPGRGAHTPERAIVDINGRWLVLCPPSIPSRPSLGAVLGSAVLSRRNASSETTSAPLRPSISCEVDSPDMDTLFGKVARGVAQELVKGAKWLGDQGYQSWQSYWRKDQSPPATTQHQAYSPPAYPAYLQGVFPPTHADLTQTTKEPEIVSIFDLQSSQDLLGKRHVEDLKPIATFQPPRGCSYVSFAPQGLNLLTSGRKGDVQYVWDLMQIRHCRSFLVPTDDDRTRSLTRVRQIARYERLSGSTIVDVAWDGLAGARFAILTKNKTVHLFDLPQSAFRWPPPRVTRRARPAAMSIDTSLSNTQADLPQSSGFFASAMSIANKAQPMVAGWRGRAPSMGGGLAGIGSTGIGLASATGAKGGKVVAAGLSKSLGAASETVSSIRHAGDGRLHLKSTKESVAGRVYWGRRGRKPVLCVLDTESMKSYHVRRSRLQGKGSKDNSSVFEVRKPVHSKLPKSNMLRQDLETPERHASEAMMENGAVCTGFWNSKPLSKPMPSALPHPLSFAEIETNAPYQPFHTDRRVALSTYSESLPQTGGSLVLASRSSRTNKQLEPTAQRSLWVFGDDIPVSRINLNRAQLLDDEETYSGSVIYRETTVTSPIVGDNDMEHIVSTTRRSKKKRGSATQHEQLGSPGDEDVEFEDGCEVLDFATDRV